MHVAVRISEAWVETHHSFLGKFGQHCGDLHEPLGVIVGNRLTSLQGREVISGQHSRRGDLLSLEGRTQALVRGRCLMAMALLLSLSLGGEPLPRSRGDCTVTGRSERPRCHC